MKKRMEGWRAIVVGTMLWAAVSAQNTGMLLMKECKQDVSGCPVDILGQFPVCGDCSSFLKCAGRAPSAMFRCVSGLSYDVNLGVCQFSSLAVTGCEPTSTAPVAAASVQPTQPMTKSPTSMTTTPTTTTPTTTTPPTTTPTTTTPTTTTSPTTTPTTTMPTTTTTSTTTTPTTTTPTTTTPTTTTSTTTTPTTTTPTTTKPPPPPPTPSTTTVSVVPTTTPIPGCIPSCGDLPQGLYPSCRGCDYFFVCFGISVDMEETQCLDGLVWDNNLQVCLPESSTCSKPLETE